MSKVVDLVQYKQDKEEAIIKRQHEEFVSLIKYFVYIQDKKYDAIHIKVNECNDIIFTDNFGNILMTENAEDLLITNMLSFSANTYILHGAKHLDTESINTLKEIFENKLIVFEE